MANVRFTISADPAVRAAIKAHADAAGMDVSAYMVAAAIGQMASDDAATSVFTHLDAANAAAMDEAETMNSTPLPALEDLSAEELLLVQRVLGSALHSETGVA